MTDKKVLKIQFYLNIILAVVLLFKYNDVYFWGYLIILVLTLLLSKNAKAFKLLSIIFFPIIFVDQFTFLINLLIKLLPHFITIIYFLYFIGALTLIVPVTKESYAKIKTPIFRLLASSWLTVSVLATNVVVLKNIEHDTFLYGFNNSAITNALVVFVYMYCVIKSWGYRFYFNLPFNFSNKKNIIMLILTASLSIWIILFSAFNFMAINWSEVFWNWNFSLINPLDSKKVKNVWELLFFSARAGIAEESERYINLLLLLIIFKSRKLRVEWSILGSSFIFALSHILNVFSAPPYQMKPDQVVHQVVNAFGIGCFLAVLFLYSGKLWLTMLIHTFADIVALSITSIGMIGETLLDPFTQTFIDLSSWLILAAILFLFNKQTVKHTATILTKNKNI